MRDETREDLLEVFHDDDPLDVLAPGDELVRCGAGCGAVLGRMQLRRPDVPYEASEVLMCPACASEVEELYEPPLGLEAAR